VGVIKQAEFVNITGIAPSAGMRTPVYPVQTVTPEFRSINNGEQPDEPIQEEQEQQDVISEQELEEQRLREEREAEQECIKQRFILECEQALDEAREEASQIIEKANEQAAALREAADKECAELREKAREAGYAEGSAAGEKSGHAQGFAKGQEDCRAALDEVSAVIDRIPDEKDKIFKEYENRLFDVIFTISNKITVGSLTQKDKSVISKMLKEAAKEFRTSSYIKVSLSKLDIEESVNVDIEDLTQIFGENQHIEFEILKDAPKGTLILDNGSEITDAGISTQLKMIQNLGMGKFKNKPEEDDE
jgi:flagellar assembly protein FliH